MDEIYELLSRRLLPVHYLNAKIKKGDFFFNTQVQPVPPRRRSALLCRAQTWGSAKPSPLTHPQQRRCPRAAGSASSEAGNKQGMCCSLVYRRWHRAFILTRARVHIYSLGVGKVSYISCDGSKAPGQRARLRSALAARGRRDQRRSPGISRLGLGLPLLLRLPGTRR